MAKKGEHRIKIGLECQICKKTEQLETHHINQQKDCENGFVIDKPHIPKNIKNNLVVLCKTCHISVHHGNLIINGYKPTTNGKILDYEENTKLTEKQINFIKKMKLDYLNDIDLLNGEYGNFIVRHAQNKFYEKYKMKTTKIIVKNIWNNVSIDSIKNCNMAENNK